MANSYRDIAARQLQGRATPAEQEALRRWRAESPAHEAQYQEQQRLWHLTAPAPARAIDTDAAWQQVKARLQARQEAKVIPMFRTVLQVAAVVATLVGMAWLIQYYFFPYFGLEVVRSGDRQVAVILPDSSRAWLNQGSLLAYNPDFEDETRRVQLEGEAFFEVRRNLRRPFIIRAEETQTKVLGTSFNLRAYPEEATVELAVATGKVAFSAAETDVEVLVAPGLAATLSKQNNTISTYSTPGGNPWAWRSGRLQFDGQALAEVLPMLERYYGVTLRLQQEALAGCRFTGAFQNAELQEVLQVLGASLQINIAKQDEQTYTLKGEGCR